MDLSSLGVAQVAPPETEHERLTVLQGVYGDAQPDLLLEVARYASENLIAFLVSPERSPREVAAIGYTLREGHFEYRAFARTSGWNGVVICDLRKYGLIFDVRDRRHFLNIRASNPVMSGGADTLPRRLFDQMAQAAGNRCNLCKMVFQGSRLLEPDHKVPKLVADISLTSNEGLLAYQLACKPCNRDKRHACDSCPNSKGSREWSAADREQHIEVCRRCFWHNPDDYDHVETVPAVRVQLTLLGDNALRIRQVADADGRTVEEHVRLKLLGE